MLLARISSFTSDFGSRPFHTRNSGLLGNGTLSVPCKRYELQIDYKMGSRLYLVAILGQYTYMSNVYLVMMHSYQVVQNE
jgi:hypothetical protein